MQLLVTLGSSPAVLPIPQASQWSYLIQWWLLRYIWHCSDVSPVSSYNIFHTACLPMGRVVWRAAVVACRSAGHGDGEPACVAAEGCVVARKATPSQVSSAAGKTSGSR